MYLILMLKDRLQEHYMCFFSKSFRNNLYIILHMVKGNAQQKYLLNDKIWQSSVPA